MPKKIIMKIKMIKKIKILKIKNNNIYKGNI